jgi:aminoglycoside/choline kinase family phosphotransferase
MDARETALRDWASALSGYGEWATVKADASSRRYFRLSAGGRSVICADSPPESENNRAFLAVHELLASAGLPVPSLLDVDLERGFMLLEDFGDRHLQDALDALNPTADYLGALPLLADIQAVEVSGSGLPAYGRGLLSEEYSRFHQWFCGAFLQMPERARDTRIVNAMGELLVRDALAQPRVLVYRDYHCRNLLLRPDGSLGLIDFQDAVAGPLCYDLASLLKDCYLRWEPEQVADWVSRYRDRLLALNRPAGDDVAQFARWFDWIGLHRHLKVLGNFTRLALRDGKTGYLPDIPLVLRYIREVLPRYPEFGEFQVWFESEVMPRAAAVRWEGRR